ncbi:AAA family ATPase [Streptomyces sp. ADMS]|uniref:AAA family ATPase n=1 Tax=Streptomyces sp. ADMS TaxID=3071415 RepID=UPI00296FC387|nr:AAA family ATPase [Streptomyces sp. ADMS]MDW4906237.1 AAA family ATPase [Streptomyces sp. ADMS]
MAAQVDAELVLGGTAARFDRTGARLFGRERESDAIDRGLRDPDGPRLVLVRGERGVGRSAFTRAAAERLRAEGIAVLRVDCVPGDGERPLLLALRLFMALEEHRSAAARRRSARQAAVEALSAVQRGDWAAMAEGLAGALAQPTPATVVVEDAQHADAESLALLGKVDFRRVPPGTRLMVTAVQHTGPDRTEPSPGSGRALEQLARNQAVHTIVLPRLGPEDVTAAVAQRLRAAPDAGLARRARQLSHGIPGALDALLFEWAGQDAIRMVDRQAFLALGAPAPVLPDGDRYVEALRALGEPCWTVAAALSILWPLGRPAQELVAASAELSAEAVHDGIRTLVDEGVVDELPGQGGAARGWTFRVPLLAHAVRERLGPLERGRLSAAAVEALWAGGAPEDPPGRQAPRTPPVAAILAEADAETYLPDRIADAGVLVDRERAVTELTTAARALYPDHERRGMVRWHLRAVRLIEEPTARDLAVLRCGQAAFGCGDYRTARAAAERIVCDPAEGLDPLALYEAATLLVASAGVGRDWPALDRMGTAPWWDGLRLPAMAAVSGRVQALWQLEKWQEALTLLSQTEPVWQSTPDSRALLELFHNVAEFVVGRPDRLTRALALPEVPGLTRDKVFARSVAQLDLLLGTGDLQGGKSLLSARELTPELLPESSQFLLRHLQGQWDEALALARRLMVNGGVLTAVPTHHLLPARTAAILLAQGRTSSADRLVASVRGRANGPLEHFLDHADAAVQRTLGDLGRAEKTLRRGLRAADERGSVYGTDELWASLAEVHAEAGHTVRAAACLERLELLAGQMNSGRTRLLYLLTSAGLRPDSADAGKHLPEAVDLARSRSQPFETAVTLLAAVRANAGPATLLREAYELFGETGATLWRFHTRSAMREAGLVVPGRKQATAENEHLLAILLAEGLTNRRIAHVLRLSEDAVANRLSRLFARTGMRSRTEVVTAVLTGSPLTTDSR